MIIILWWGDKFYWDKTLKILERFLNEIEATIFPIFSSLTDGSPSTLKTETRNIKFTTFKQWSGVNEECSHYVLSVDIPVPSLLEIYILSNSLLLSKL